MCIATADSLTGNQGHCQSLAVARVEKTQFAGWLPGQDTGELARGG